MTFGDASGLATPELRPVPIRGLGYGDRDTESHRDHKRSHFENEEMTRCASVSGLTSVVAFHIE